MSALKCLSGDVQLIGRDSASSFQIEMYIHITFSGVKSGAVSIRVFPLALYVEIFLEITHFMRSRI